LLKHGQLGEELAKKLIEKGKLPCLKEARVLKPKPHLVLAHGIKKAFFGKPDSINGWASVHARLKVMPLKEAYVIWQTIANEVAVDCFDRDDNIDDDRLRTWMEFFGDAENFKKEPFCYIPHVEFVCSQIHRECECLILNKNGARDLLNSAKNIIVGKYGQSISEAMSETSSNSAVAILASLFAPFRQAAMPTCTMHSLIIAEIQNHPERLIKMYIQMLSGDQFTFPSGYAVSLQPIVDGFITVDLKDGGEGRDMVFENIRSGNPAKIAEQKREWNEEGIEYTESTNGKEKYKLRLSVRNMNDVLYAHFLLASDFGNKNMDWDQYGTMLVYAGWYEERSKVYPSVIQIDGSDFLSGIAELKKQAKAQQNLGHYYMRVGTLTSKSGHAENIDIAALLALDPNNMEPGKAYPIGDRNWAGWDKSLDIFRLAVRKVDGIPPTFEFGTLQGSTFDKEEMLEVSVHDFNGKERDAQFWRQLSLENS
jgi:hypothetical protein